MQVSDEDYNTMADIQARADNVFGSLARERARAMNGETPPVYRRRLAKDLQKHSKTWKESISARSTTPRSPRRAANLQRCRYGGAVSRSGAGRLAARGDARSPSGHKETRFYGHPSAWMNSFSSNRRYVTKINQLKPGSL